MSAAPRVILGLDPGLALLGFGVVQFADGVVTHVAHGCVETQSGVPVPTRLRQLYDGVCDLKRRHPMTDVAMESLFHSRNVSTAMVVGEARGVAILAAVDGGTAFAEYTPTAVKQIVSGYGGARKLQMQEMVSMLLGLSVLPKPDDAADALAIAICHARHIDLQTLIASANQDRVSV